MFCVGSSEDTKCFLINLMCFVLLLRRVRREHKMLLCRSSLTKLCPKIGIIYLRFGSSESTICPHFVPSADPATQFVPILCSRRTPRRTFLSFFHFVFCVHNCVGGPGSSDIGCPFLLGSTTPLPYFLLVITTN